MPTIRLASYLLGPALSVIPPAGAAIEIPRVRFRCLVRLPQFLMPLDAIIDTGAPLVCFPRSVWARFTEGTDFEWLPFAAGVQPPPGQTAHWRFTYRMARFLVPLAVMDYSTEVDRVGVIAQFADSDPLGHRGRALPWLIVGLWGGLLEGSRLSVDRGASGQVTGELEFP